MVGSMTPIQRALDRALELGMNQSQFASALGVDPQHITNWKRRGMPAERHAAVAKLLATGGCSIR